MTPEDAKLVGGSDTGPLMRVSQFAGPLQVYLRCRHGVHTAETPEMRRGTALEATGAVLYSSITGWPVTYTKEPQRVGLPEWARVTRDGIANSPTDGRGTLEVKTCTLERLESDWGPDGSDMVPAHYATQAQWYAGWGERTGVADAGWCDVAVLAAPESTLQALAGWARAAGGVVPPEEVLALPGVRFQVHRVTLDLEVFGWEVDAAERFWRNHVVPGVPPDDAPLAGDVRAVEALAKATPAAEPLHWEALGPVERELVARWVEANRARKEVEAVEETLGTRLRLLLAGASGVVGLPAELGRRIDHRHTKSGTRPLIIRGGAT